MEEGRIVFIGAERVGKAVAQALLAQGAPICAIVTAHEDRAPHIADYVSFRDLEEQYPHVDFHYVRESKSAQVRDCIAGYAPECILVASWSNIIAPDILSLPEKGVVGMHYSLLPDRRGGAPLNWAIIDGIPATGITLYYLDDGIDTGDIIAQQDVPIDAEDTVKDLLDKIIEAAPSLFCRLIDDILDGTAPRIPQNDAQATTTSRRRPADSAIDWTMDLDALHRFIRAVAPPYPAAFTTLKTKRLVLTSAKKAGEGNRLSVTGYIEEYDHEG